MVASLILISLNLAVAGSPQPSYNLSDLDRAEYCAKSVEGFYNEGTLGERAFSAFIYGQDKYNPFIWMMRGNNDRYYAVKETIGRFPGKFQRCFATSSLDVIKEQSNCQEKIKNISSETPTSDLQKNFCILQIPKSKKDFLQPNVDVPATFITPFSKKTLRDASSSPDSEPFYQEINPEADQIWEALLKCSDNDPETARMAFVTNKSACPELNDRMSIFKTNFVNILMQTAPQKARCSEYSCGVGFELGNMGLEFADNRLNYDYFRQSYSKTGGLDDSDHRDYFSKMHVAQTPHVVVHPLISQMALQILIKMYLFDSSQNFFNRDRFTKDFSDEYQNFFYKLLDIILTVNNNSGIPMGLYPNAGWAAWSQMRERVILSKERLSPTWKRHSGEAYQHDRWDRRLAKWDLERFYRTFNPNYGVVTSNIKMVNLPQIYFKQGSDILEQFYKADPVFTNIKIQEDKK